MIGLIPVPYRIAAATIAAVALFLCGLGVGIRWETNATQAALKRAAEREAETARQSAAATVRVVTQYVDRIQTVREKGADIIKEVPVYVTAESDHACTVPRGFVRLHDAAAAGTVPGPAGTADAAPAGIALSAVAATVADNYSRCHENSIQLEAIQDWIRQMQAAAE